jgi:hypothetical protein
METPWPSPICAWESNTTTLNSGRTAKFRECCASGDESQFSSAYPDSA